MSKPNRLREARNVTLNPLLVTHLLEAGAAQGETNLSRLLDECMRCYLGKRRGRATTRGEGEGEAGHVPHPLDSRNREKLGTPTTPPSDSNT